MQDLGPDPGGRPALKPLTKRAPRVRVVADRSEAERAVAAEIRELLADRTPRRGRPVLGLATGETMRGLFAELIRLAEAGSLDLAGVRTFNLDEYLGSPAGSPASFRAWMSERLFRAAGLDPAQAAFPELLASDADERAASARYEREIAASGGIDLQLLGIGRNGHLAFNEPGSTRTSRTRPVELAAETREDAERAFARHGLPVPERALTMGVATILEARRLRLLAFGAGKAAIVRAALEGPVGPRVPASFVREHPDCDIWLDAAAAAHLRKA